METDITLWSTSRQAAAIRAGEITSRQLLEAMIIRIEQVNPTINAVITLDIDAARDSADKADVDLANGNNYGPLHGIPVTIKDALEVINMRSTGGAKELQDNFPDKDADVVCAVKQAGAFVFGKTNLPRWSGDVQAYNDMFGTTNNPWNRDCVPGGSSGGAAAAVATGMTSFEIGTDIAGSIRFPSSFCGVYGHKPSWGIVGSRGYLDHKSGGTTEADVNVHGPIARSAEDLALLLSLLVKRDEPLVANLKPALDVGSMRIAAWIDDDFCRLDKEVLSVISSTLDKIETSGLAIDRHARPDIDATEAFQLGVQLVGAAMLQSQPEETSDETVMSHRQWLDANMKREAIRGKWQSFFEDYDAIIMPVSFVPPFKHLHEGDFWTRSLVCNGEERAYIDLLCWTILTGMAYLPSTVPPLGLGSSGLPIGFQVVGPYGSDYSTIRLAGYIGELTGGYQAPGILEG
ncbi:MAG: amidase [Granulosicoccus sp.]|jgi:amidase